MLVKVDGEIITGNMFLIVPLFLASPWRRSRRLYFLFFLSALAGLLVIQVFTLGCFAQHALQKIPEVKNSTGMLAARLLDTYLNYSYLGLYVLLIATWFPYIALVMMRTRKR
jgi:uncharacterized membrane protein YhaH (DUF805 family)